MISLTLKQSSLNKNIIKMSFKNKVVIVTGAGSGIGAATAELFANERADLVMVDYNGETLKKMAEEVKNKTGVNPLVIKADISNEREARSIINKTILHFQKLHVLVNNAGVSPMASVLSDNYLNTVDTVFSTNLRGTIILTHAAIPYLIKTKGNIVNVSSVASSITLLSHSAYSTSKAALDHFSKCLALELAEHGVRVNLIRPGPVKTDISSTFGMPREEFDEYYKNVAKLTPLRHVSESIEIAKLIIFVASDKAKSITGSSNIIDCGLSLAPNGLLDPPNKTK